MKKFMIVLSLPLAFAMGCGGSESTDPADNTSDNGGGGGNDNGGGPGDDVGTIESGLVVAQAPTGLTGDFYFGSRKSLTCNGWGGDCDSRQEALACTNTTSCETSVAGSITVEFTCPNHLFVLKEANGNAKYKITVVWDQSGDWGLAPNGTYYDDDGGHEHAVQTAVENLTGHQYQILLREDTDVIGAVKGESFAWSEDIVSFSGTIAVDLKTIVYETIAKNGNKKTVRTLTLVE